MASCEVWNEFAKNNADRIGKELKSGSGRILPRTMVLSTNSYAIFPTMSDVKIICKNWCSDRDNELVVTKKEFEVLCSIKL